MRLHPVYSDDTTIRPSRRLRLAVHLIKNHPYLKLLSDDSTTAATTLAYQDTAAAAAQVLTSAAERASRRHRAVTTITLARQPISAFPTVLHVHRLINVDIRVILMPIKQQQQQQQQQRYSTCSTLRQAFVARITAHPLSSRQSSRQRHVTSTARISPSSKNRTVVGFSRASLWMTRPTDTAPVLRRIASNTHPSTVRLSTTSRSRGRNS